jgi:hypothetical protein
MKTTDNFHPAECCRTCKHSFHFNPGILYASEWAIMHRIDDSPTVYYCNGDGSCPAKTQEEFESAGNTGEYNNDSAEAKWLGLSDPEDPTSSDRFVGSGLGVCDMYEPSSEQFDEEPGDAYDVYYYCPTEPSCSPYRHMVVKASSKQQARYKAHWFVYRRTARHSVATHVFKVSARPSYAGSYILSHCSSTDEWPTKRIKGSKQ